MDNKKRRWFPWQPKRGADHEIQELLQRIAEKPDDPRLHQRLAELYLERGSKNQAVGEFIRAAECHSEAGFYLRAIALYRRILRMEEESSEILLRLAELYLVNGLLGDALVQYRKVIQQYRKQGKNQEILGLLRKMLDADPENLEVRTKYVELVRSEGFLPQALDEMIRLYLVQRERNRLELAEEIEGQIRSLHQELRTRWLQEGKEADLVSLEQKVQSVFEEHKQAPEQEPMPAASGQDDQIDLEAPQEGGAGPELEPESVEAPVMEEPEPEEPPLFRESEIHGQVEEASLYVDQGLYDEAEELFLAILEAEPRNREARKGLEHVRELQRAAMQPESGGELRNLDILEQRQQAQLDGTEETDDGEPTPASSPGEGHARFELGLAYRDLGLMDESILEFLAAATDPSLTFSCFRELGACYRQKGDLHQAITYLRKALQCPGVRKGDLLEAGYELAQTLEQHGMRKEALVLYRKIGETDQDFRDIQERVKSLSQ